MSDIATLTKMICEFRDERDWKQFHTPKDMALSLTLEAAEFLELFQWKNEVASQAYVTENKEALADELADIFFWVLLIGHDFDINLIDALKSKIEKNKAKYPIEKAKGKNVKYTKLV